MFTLGQGYLTCSEIESLEAVSFVPIEQKKKYKGLTNPINWNSGRDPFANLADEPLSLGVGGVIQAGRDGQHALTFSAWV